MRSEGGHTLTIQTMISDILERQPDLIARSEADGGSSRFGINTRMLTDFLGRPVGHDDIVQLTPGMAATLYRHRFWHKPRIDRLPVAVQPLVFDAAIAHGTRAAVFQLQRAINTAAVAGRIDEDGVIGPATLQAAQLAYDRLGGAFLTRLLQQRQRTYEHMIETNPDLRVSFNDWMKRLKAFATSQGIVFDASRVV